MKVVTKAATSIGRRRVGGRAHRTWLAGSLVATAITTAAAVVVPAGLATASPRPASTLGPGSVLASRAFLSSKNGRFHLVMQRDGNLVLYERPGDHLLWQSRTGGHPGAFARMQGDGNLVIQSHNRPVWASGTDSKGTAHSVLTVQDAGAALIVDRAGHALWSTLGAGPTLSLGATGPAVVSLQRRLSALGYWLGPANGIFGDSTEQAVFALQKAAGLNPDGTVDWQTYKALALEVRPTPRPAAGDLVEVDLQRDLLMIIRDGKLWVTLNTSTGGGYTYTSQGVTSVATTPTGVYHVYTEIDGADIAPLGELWRPKFFTGGYAIHGDGYVPSFPVSHGCVRVSNEAIDWIWAVNAIPIGTEVWVY